MPTKDPCEDLFAKYGTFVNLKIWDTDGQYWVNNFCKGKWRARNSTNTGWVDMTWDNTRIRSEDNTTWYQSYCTQDPCDIQPVITFPPPPTTVVTTAIPTTTTSTTTTTNNTVTLDSISFFASSKAVSGSTVQTVIDVSTTDSTDLVGKTINVVNKDTIYYFVVYAGLYNTLGVDAYTTIGLRVEYGSQVIYFNELRYGTSNNLVVLGNSKVTWSGGGEFSIKETSGYIVKATLTSSEPLDIDINLQVYKKAIA